MLFRSSNKNSKRSNCFYCGFVIGSLFGAGVSLFLVSNRAKNTALRAKETVAGLKDRLIKRTPPKAEVESSEGGNGKTEGKGG